MALYQNFNLRDLEYLVAKHAEFVNSKAYSEGSQQNIDLDNMRKCVGKCQDALQKAREAENAFSEAEKAENNIDRTQKA